MLEDAVSGVRAGAAGGFGLVVGVDRGAGADALTDGRRRRWSSPTCGSWSREAAPSAAGRPDGPRPVPGRPVAAGRDRAPTPTTSASPRPSSPSPTATSACAATPSEGRDAYAHGTFINGFHETWPIRHAEAAFGFARTGQTIVNVPDAKLMKLYVDDEPLNLGTADLEHYERVLDFRDGVLRRSLVWRTPSGKRVRVDSTRMVSMTQRHLAVLTLEVTMLDGRRARS